jgi:hypothetical protein
MLQTSDPNQTGWTIFDGDASRIPAGADVLIPLDEWRERAAVWRSRTRRLGVLLAPSDDPAMLADDLDQLELVAFARVGSAQAGTGAPVQLEPVHWPLAGRHGAADGRRVPA